MKAHTPSRHTALLCLTIFIRGKTAPAFVPVGTASRSALPPSMAVVGLIGVFVPLAHIQYIGPYLKLINQLAVYLLIGGYGLLLAAVYIL